MLDKPSKDNVTTGSTSGVKFLLQLPGQKAVMQALSIIDCPAEAHLLLGEENFGKTSQLRLRRNPC